VTQAPITAAIIVFEVTGKCAMPAPLVAVAVLACGVSRLMSPVSLYHALARDFSSQAARQTGPSETTSS
jgi:H+/Cl- antiporter ClcA